MIRLSELEVVVFKTAGSFKPLEIGWGFLLGPKPGDLLLISHSFQFMLQKSLIQILRNHNIPLWGLWIWGFALDEHDVLDELLLNINILVSLFCQPRECQEDVCFLITEGVLDQLNMLH